MYKNMDVKNSRVTIELLTLTYSFDTLLKVHRLATLNKTILLRKNVYVTPSSLIMCVYSLCVNEYTGKVNNLSLTEDMAKRRLHASFDIYEMST